MVLELGVTSFMLEDDDMATFEFLFFVFEGSLELVNFVFECFFFGFPDFIFTCFLVEDDKFLIELLLELDDLVFFLLEVEFLTLEVVDLVGALFLEEFVFLVEVAVKIGEISLTGFEVLDNDL